MCKKKGRKKRGKKTTLETSEKSQELEAKVRGAYKGGGLFTARAKKKKVVSIIDNYWWVTKYVSMELVL